MKKMLLIGMMGLLSLLSGCIFTFFIPESNVFTISFNTNGGSNIEEFEVGRYDHIDLNQYFVPTKEGHTFGGWYNDPFLLGPYNPEAEITDHITVHAKWIVNTYTITFDTDGGEPIEPMTIPFGETLDLPMPDKLNRTFDYYYEVEGEVFNLQTMPARNMLLHVKWKDNLTVYIYFDGEPTWYFNFNRGDTMYTSELVVTKTGFEFAGIYEDEALTIPFPDSMVITQDLIVYLKLHEKFIAEFFDHTAIIDTVHFLETEQIIPIDDPESNNLVFMYWYETDENEPFDFSVIPNRNVVLYAKWSAEEGYAQVSFESNGGSFISPVVILIETSIVPINPVKENYVFSGWFADQALEIPFDFESLVTTDITLYAKWDPISTPTEVDYSLDGDTLLWDEVDGAVFYDVYIGEDAIDPHDVDIPSIDLKPYESTLLEPTKIEVYAVYPFGNGILIVDVVLQYQNQNIIYQTGFEADEGFTASTQYNNTSPKLQGPANYQYSIVRGSASTGSQAFPVISGGQGMQLRWYTANPEVMGYIETEFTLSHVSSIRFTAKSSDHHLKVSYNTDETSNIDPEIFILTGTPQIFTYEVSTNAEISIRFELVQVSSSNSSPVFIDDIIIYSSLGDNTLVELPKAAPGDYPETDETLLLELKNQFQGPRNSLAAPGFTIPMSNEGLLNYYASLNDLTGQAFRTELQNILISTHTRLISYNEARFVLEQADLITDEEGRQYLDGIYAGTKIVKYWDGGATWAREHVWPNSRLAMDRVEGGQRNQASDVHNLRAINPSVNSSRSNRYFDQGLSSLNQLVGTTAYYPGDEYIGDVARILFYMVVRYHNILTLADTGIDDYPAYSAEGAIMGILTLLLEWHELDPVSDFEIRRNDIIYSYQGNRNPFIDFPEYAEVYFG